MKCKNVGLLQSWPHYYTFSMTSLCKVLTNIWNFSHQQLLFSSYNNEFTQRRSMNELVASGCMLVYTL